MRYYLVTTKCGHVGRGYYMPITFPIKAENGREAALIARNCKRVKHHHWDAILALREVSIEEYYAQMKINDHDPYLHATNHQSQDEVWDLIKDRVCEDNHQYEVYASKRTSRRPNLYYQSRKYDYGRNDD